MDHYHYPPPDMHPRHPLLKISGIADCHFHIFGPQDRYPYDVNRMYTPRDALVSDYLKVKKALGLEKGVIIQAGPQGMDNTRLLDALDELGPHYRGIAVVDPLVSEEELEEMHKKGVRGVRVNLVSKGGINFNDLHLLEAKMKNIKWHIEFYLDGAYLDKFYDELKNLKMNYVIDHMGHFSAAEGTSSPGFKTLLNLLKTGFCWVKLTAPYRLSSENHPPYGDVTPIAKALINAAPTRLVWGTDWPHTRIRGLMPNDADLLDLLLSWTEDQATQRAILAENPSKLYGF